MSNEKEIRKTIKEFLSENINGIVVDEFTGGTMKTRPDVVIIGDRFIFVEIKSDRDSLSRLDNQVSDYTRYCDEVIVILDETHREQYERKYRKCLHWHIIGFFKDGKINFDNNIENRIKNIDKRILIDLPSMLWAEERRRLLNPLGKVPNTKEFEALQYCYTPYELDILTREIIINRWDFISRQEKRFNKGFNGGNITSQIKHIEYKKLLIDEFIITNGINYKTKRNNHTKQLKEKTLF